MNINNIHNKVKLFNSKLKHSTISRGITTLATSSATTTCLVLTLKIIGVYSVFFYVFRLGMMPQGGGASDVLNLPLDIDPSIKPATNNAELITMLHNRVDFLQGFLTGSHTIRFDRLAYHNDLMGVLKYLHAN